MFSASLLLFVIFSCIFAAPNPNVIPLTYKKVNEGPVVNPFVVGGKDAEVLHHPHIVSLLVDFGSKGVGLCGGTIIDNEWVLTAAHCFYDGLVVGVVSVDVRAGSNYYYQGGNVHYGVLVVLNNYRPLLNLNDYALVKVIPSFSTDLPVIRPISLPVQGSRPAEGAIAVIAGWGTTTEGGSLPSQLQSANVSVINQASCRSAYGTIIRDSMFCAGVIGSGVDTCQGDSGGPIVVSNVVAGIVSFGNGCARNGYPGVYTNVGSFSDIINRAIKEN